MTDTLYKGCVIPARFPFIEAAVKYLIGRLDLDIKDAGERPCCIEPVGLRSLNSDVWHNVTSHICSNSGERIVTICDGCTVSLSGYVKESGSGPEISGFMEILYRNLDRIRENVVSPCGMSLAVFPGCHSESTFAEKGMDAVAVMSEILSAVGAKPLVPEKNLCCGGGVSSIDNELSKRILNESVESFKRTGAEGVVTSCPFCFMQFDLTARYRAYSIYELVAKSLGWDVDTERFHRAKK